MSERCYRYLSWLFVSIGLALIIVAAYGYVAPAPPLAIEATTDVELANCAPGQKMKVVFQLHNHSGRTVPIFGLVQC